MANLAAQWSHEVRERTEQTKRYWGLSELSFGMICLALLAVVAITASLICPAIDWTTTDFLVGP
jgi:hypothetical protein